MDYTYVVSYNTNVTSKLVDYTSLVSYNTNVSYLKTGS